MSDLHPKLTGIAHAICNGSVIFWRQAGPEGWCPGDLLTDCLEKTAIWYRLVQTRMPGRQVRHPLPANTTPIALSDNFLLCPGQKYFLPLNQTRFPKLACASFVVCSRLLTCPCLRCTTRVNAPECKFCRIGIVVVECFAHLHKGHAHAGTEVATVQDRWGNG
jgi:hypothetical protein